MALLIVLNMFWIHLLVHSQTVLLFYHHHLTQHHNFFRIVNKSCLPKQELGVGKGWRGHVERVEVGDSSAVGTFFRASLQNLRDYGGPKEEI